SAGEAAWALGLVSLVAVPGQIAFGHLSDRIGREWVWTIGNAGFVLCGLALVFLSDFPAAPLLYAMVIAQGTIGYSLTSAIAATPGTAARCARTAAASIPSGTASSASPIACRTRSQVP